MKYLLIIIFIIGLLYILLPDPGEIEQFSPIPNSLKSDEPGDTFQVPNIAAYFSGFNRKEITDFYRNEYRQKYLFGGLIPPITLNYSPLDAWQYVRDRQKSTFLEEYLYPFHGTFFVNGYEEYTANELIKRKHDPLGDRIQIKGQYFTSKTTLRFYPTLWIVRLVTYLGMWAVAISMFKLYKEALIKEVR